jgi:prepilin-type N-terminal cleavage/methylation domain-containing protein
VKILHLFLTVAFFKESEQARHTARIDSQSALRLPGKCRGFTRNIMKTQVHKYPGRRQSGMTLMEVISSLAIMAVVVVGALALYGSASSSQSATAFTQDLTSIRAGLKQLYSGQGTYGASGTNLNAVLKSAKRIPTTMSVDNSTPPVITHSLNGTLVAAAGATAGQFTLTVTNIPTDVCTAIAVSNSSWISLGAGASGTTPIALPATPATAAAGCSTTNANTMIFTGA